MIELSDDLLRLEPGRIVHLSPRRSSPAAGTWSVTVPLVTFSAADLDDPATFRPGTDGPEIVKTAVVGEFIHLPGNDLARLTERTFDFPVNPHPGYIDASIYLGGGHNPVDITRMAFGTAHSQRIDVVTACRIRRHPGRRRDRTGQRFFPPTFGSSSLTDADRRPASRHLAD